MSDEADSEEPYVVPGRECGACTACCKDLAIVQPKLTKLPGIMCQYCIPGGGCAIYETRFENCRDYHCGWRSLPNLDDGWRPDRSGVLITLEFPNGQPAVDLILVGGEAASRSDRFAGMAAGFIESGTLTYVVLPADQGLTSYRVRMNELLGPAIQARNLAEVKAIIAGAVATLKEQPPVPISAELMRPVAVG